MIQAGKDPGQPSCQHRLPASRCAAKEDVVASGCRHFKGAACFVLADHLCQIYQTWISIGGVSHGFLSRQYRTAVQDLDDITEMADRPDRHPLHQPGLGILAGRHHGTFEPCLASRQQCREYPTHWSYPPVKPQFPHENRRPEQGLRDLSIRSQGRSGNGEIEVSSGLRQASGGEVDRQDVARPGHAGGTNRSPTPIPSLVQGHVRKADEYRTRQARRYGRLHLDQAAFQPHQGNRPCACPGHWMPRTCVIVGCSPGRTMTPMASIRTECIPFSWSTNQTNASS